MNKKKISHIKNNEIHTLSKWNWGTTRNDNIVYDAIIKIENKINEIVDYINTKRGDK